VLEDLCLDTGTYVASAGTAENICEIVKCLSDVDMTARVRMGSVANFQVFSGFSILVAPTIEICRCLDSGIVCNTEDVN